MLNSVISSAIYCYKLDIYALLSKIPAAIIFEGNTELYKIFKEFSNAIQ